MWVRSREGNLYNLSNAENVILVWGHSSMASSGRIIATFSGGREATLFESRQEAQLREVLQELGTAVLNNKSVDLSQRSAPQPAPQAADPT